MPSLRSLSRRIGRGVKRSVERGARAASDEAGSVVEQEVGRVSKEIERALRKASHDGFRVIDGVKAAARDLECELKLLSETVRDIREKLENGEEI